MSQTTGINKKNGHRQTLHASWYAGLRTLIAKRKDRNVKRSSRGKFASVADLVKHQATVSLVRVKPTPAKVKVYDNWLTTDRGSRSEYADNYLTACWASGFTGARIA